MADSGGASGRLGSEDTPAASAAPVGLWRIFVAFLRLGGTSFGGGTAGWLYREMVLRRGWIDEQGFLAMLAVGQVMPGSNGVKMTVLIGQQLRGAAGAATALIGLLTAPFAIVIAIGTFYLGLGEHRIVQAMLDGVAAAVIGLNLATGLSSMKGAPGIASWTIATVTVFCVGILRWPMLPVMAGLAPISIGLALVEARRR
jgi:chromate transporter